MICKALTPNLMVENVKVCLDFYTQVLGFTLIASVPEIDENNPSLELDFAMIKNAGVTIMLQSQKSFLQVADEFKNKPIATATIYIDVEEINSFYQSALQHKCIIVTEPHTTFYGTKEFTMRDNSGYILSFAEGGD